MKSKHLVYLLLGVVTLLSGCASQKGMPSFALTQPEQGMTVTHPDQMEDDGGTIITFTGVLPPRFLVEVDEGMRGVWPLPGISLINKEAPMINGFCYSVPDEAFDKNPWAIMPMQCVILGSKKKLIDEQYAFALANKDGGVWIASPIGDVEGHHTIIDDQTYDFDKFESDPEYAIELMQEIGKTLPVISEVWEDRVHGFGVDMTADDVQEIAIVDGDLRWEAFREKMLVEMGGELRLPDGEIVASYLSEEEMEQLLRRNPHITSWQKFLSRLRLPIGTPEMMAFGLASSAIDGGIATFFDDRWNVCVARGTCQRRDLSEQLAFVYQLYQKEHVKRMTGGR